MEQFSLTRPDDWHCHLRDDEFLARTVTDTSQRFARAIVMPNLSQPITTVKQAQDYRTRILAHVPKNIDFSPLMTLYLTENLTKQVIAEAKTSGIITAFKLYPKGATTLSASGISNLEKIYPLFEAMQNHDIPLLIHGESIDPHIDVFEREKEFIERELTPLLKSFPDLRVVLEHISTIDAVQFVQDGPPQLAATLTAHHLWLNRNALFMGGINPHYYCLPILKSAAHQQALINAAMSGSSKFFLGTDSAPHIQSQKESACGCAGIYTACAGIELYAQLFSEHKALDKLEKFASLNGPQFYRLPINKQRLTLQKQTWQIPKHLPFGHGIVIPFFAEKSLDWRVCPP